MAFSGLYVVCWRGWRMFGDIQIRQGVVTCRVMTGATIQHAEPDIDAVTLRWEVPIWRHALRLIDTETGRVAYVQPERWRYQRTVTALAAAGFSVRDEGVRVRGLRGFRDEPRGMPDASGLLFAGITVEGLHIRVIERPGEPPQRFAVFVEGKQVAITRADRLRDGGTTIIEIPQGTLVDPRRSTARPGPVTFNGVEVLPT